VSEVEQDVPTFFSLYAAGQISAEQIDDFIGAWHGSSDEERRSLADYLGMSDDEYAVWLMSHCALPSILAARREGRPLAEVIGEHLEDRRRNRPHNRSAICALSHWLGRPQV
jgi:hypothetical protein